MRARTGKIARLPLTIREELNRRLLENEPARKIMAWVNVLPEAIRVCDEFGEQPIDDRNISDWRKGGYQDWLRKRERVEETRELAQWSVKIAKAAGGNISEGASAILAGKLLEVLEGIAELKDKTEAEAGGEDVVEKMAAIANAMDKVSTALANVRKGDHSKERLDIQRERLGLSGESLKLEREKFEIMASRKLLDQALRKRAEEINSSDLSNEEKIAEMRKAAFGDVDALEASGEVVIP